MLFAPVAIIPAAGRSLRMGRPKLHLPFRSTTVIGATVAALRAGGVPQIVIVVGGQDTATPAWAAAHGLRSAVNPRPPEDGMLTSVWAGMAALGGAAVLAAGGAPLLVCPGDLPLLRATTVSRLLAAAVGPNHHLLVPTYRGGRGHPIVVAADLVAEIPRLDPHVGLRSLRERFPERTRFVEVDDPGVVRDVDTPEEYDALQAPVDPGAR